MYREKERDAIPQLKEGKPTHARHITQWHFILKRRFCCCFSEWGSVDAGVEEVFSLALPLLIKEKCLNLREKPPRFLEFTREKKISMSYGVLHCVIWIRH